MGLTTRHFLERLVGNTNTHQHQLGLGKTQTFKDTVLEKIRLSVAWRTSACVIVVEHFNFQHESPRVAEDFYLLPTKFPQFEMHSKFQIGGHRSLEWSRGERVWATGDAWLDLHRSFDEAAGVKFVKYQHDRFNGFVKSVVTTQLTTKTHGLRAWNDLPGAHWYREQKNAFATQYEHLMTSDARNDQQHPSNINLSLSSRGTDRASGITVYPWLRYII